MPSRAKKLRIPAALVFALIAPGGLSCSSSNNTACDSYCTPAQLNDAGMVLVGDAGPSDCSGPDDPRLTDPRWICTGVT